MVKSTKMTVLMITSSSVKVHVVRVLRAVKVMTAAIVVTSRKMEGLEMTLVVLMKEMVK